MAIFSEFKNEISPAAVCRRLVERIFFKKNCRKSFGDVKADLNCKRRQFRLGRQCINASEFVFFLLLFYCLRHVDVTLGCR